MSALLMILLALGFVGVPVGVGVAAYQAGKHSAASQGQPGTPLLPSGEGDPRLVGISPYKAEADSIREARRQMRLLDVSGLPELREKRDRVLSQLESFCTVSDNVEHEISELFTCSSVTYDVHIDAFYAACERFLENELVAAAMLKRFDAQRYARLKAQVAEDERHAVFTQPAQSAQGMLPATTETGIVLSENLETDIVRIESLMSNGDYADAEEELGRLRNKYSASSSIENDALAGMKAELDEVDEILESNEAMLANIDKFSAKLRELGAARRGDADELARRELDRISENLRYYE